MAHNGPPTASRLAATGLRVTRQRVAVLDAIGPGEHLEADTIAVRTRAVLGSISTQAVYDVLRVLDTAGLLRRIEPAGKPALYEIRVGDNHHHLVCRTCGSVADVDCTVGAAPCLHAADDVDFVVDEVEVVFWGTCFTCRPSTHQPTANAEEAAV